LLSIQGDEGDDTEVPDAAGAAATPEAGAAPAAPRRRQRRQAQLLPGSMRIRRTAAATLLCWPKAAPEPRRLLAVAGATSIDGAAPTRGWALSGEPVLLDLVAPPAAVAPENGAAAEAASVGDLWVLPVGTVGGVRPGAAVWLSDAAPGGEKHEPRPGEPQWLWCLLPGGGGAVGRVSRPVLEAAAACAAAAGPDGGGGEGMQGGWRGWCASIRTIRWGAEGAVHAGTAGGRVVRGITLRLRREQP
jgi:hypothetical protein